MKMKEAIELIRSKSHAEEDLWPLLVGLYKSEADERIFRRSAGRVPTQNAVAGIADEMGQWVELVARGVSLKEEHIKLLIDTARGNLFAKYRMLDPVAEKQINVMRAAVQRGRHPIEVLTQEGLEAMGSMMMGQVAQEARDYYKDRGVPCPHGVEARFCKYQETYSKGFPTGNVEDLSFICTMVNPERCDWRGDTSQPPPNKGGQQ